MTDGSKAAPSGQTSRPIASRTRTDPSSDGSPGDVARTGKRPRSPNYAARRMLVTTIGITALVAAGVGGWRLLRDEPNRVGDGSVSWSEIVFVDRGTGAAIAVSPDDPTVAAALGPATGRVTAVHVEGPRVALVQPGQITLTGLDGQEPVVIPIELGSVVTRLPIVDALWLAVGSSTGGNLVLVDGKSGTQHDIGALTGQADPRFYVETLRFDPTGTSFAVADANNFQTIVVRTASDPATASFFPDQPIAVNDELVVTSQVVGQQADLTLLDADRQNLATVSGELPAGGILVDDEVTVVSIGGTVSRFGRDDTDAERLGTVAVPAGAEIQWVRQTADRSRFVVFGEVFEAVVDLDGRTVFTTTFPTAVDAPTIEAAWSCLPVGGGDTFQSLVDLESGEQLADLAGVVVTGVSADGCTVLVTRAGTAEVIGSDGSVTLGQVRAATLAPDGRAVVVQTATGDTQLVRIDDWALEQPIDLTEHASGNPIVAFRDA